MSKQNDTLFKAPQLSEQERMLEAILFATAEPISKKQIEDRLPHGSDASEALALLEKRYASRGVILAKIGDGYALRTAPDLGFLMQKEATELRKLSKAAIETLAIIAYHQPVTRAQIEEIRGVSVSRGTIDQLLDLTWIKLGRRKMTPGRPITFITTQEFLDHFGLEASNDLPGIRELRDAGLLDNQTMLQSIDFDGDQDEPLDDENQSEMFS